MNFICILLFTLSFFISRSWTLKLKTNLRDPYTFFKVNKPSLTFSVKASHDVWIALTTEPLPSLPMLEISIGAEANTKTLIKKNHKDSNEQVFNTKSILPKGEFEEFILKWEMGWVTLEIGEYPVPGSLLTWEDANPAYYTHVGVGSGSTADWDLKDVAVVTQAYSECDAERVWTDDNGDNARTFCAVEAGDYEHAESPYFVGRARHDNGWLAGQLGLEGLNLNWNNKAYNKQLYQVAVICSAKWVHSSKGKAIPSLALPAGRSPDGRLNYPCRVNHHNVVIAVGHVLENEQICHISYEDKVYSYEQYDILTIPIDPLFSCRRS